MKGIVTVPSRLRFILLLFALAIIVTMSYYDDSIDTDASLTSRVNTNPFGGFSLSVGAIVVIITIVLFLLLRKRT